MKRIGLGVAAALAVTGMGAAVAQQRQPAAQANQPVQVDRSIMHVQVILDHLGFSPGVIDGRTGKSTVAALKGFQERTGLPETGEMDQRTLGALNRWKALRPTRQLTLSESALAGPFVNPMPKDPMEQARLPALGYRNAAEKLAEMFHTTPAVLVALNPGVTKLAAGEKLVVPNALPTSRNYDPKLPEAWRATLASLNVDANQPQGARIVVDKSEEVLKVYDKQDRLVGQFMATMGSEHDPLPLGKWTIKGPAYNPPFHYNAALFWDADDKNEKAKLPPGPNGPVGVVWLDLSKPHYGIHGTPNPETIGRAESHGCIRLTNWDAARLALMVEAGTPAVFQA